MAQYGFGSGVLFGVRTDVSTATPVQFGALQDVSVDIQFNIKELYGQSQFPLAVARSTAKITGKAKLARIIGRSFNDLFFGQDMTAGQTLMAFQEAGAVPAATPWTVTVANAAGFIADFGVINAGNGLALVKVASAPAAGQYAVDAGVYTFAAADANLGVLLSYSYAPTVNTAGQTIAIANQLIGSAPQFKCVLNGNYQQKQFSLTLNACIANKLQIATKIEDFTIPELDFSAFADAAGNVGSISFAEAS
jgi:hypothetical protein